MRKLMHVAYSVFLCGFIPAVGQQATHKPVSVVDDWTHHHVIFSNPGTKEEAERNGRLQEWTRIVSHRRYYTQWYKRYGSLFAQAATLGERAEVALPELPQGGPNADLTRRKKPRLKNGLHGDWAVPLAATVTAGVAVAPDVFPAKYTFSVTDTPSCTIDFVVYPINASGSTSQANILGVTNLYKSACTGTVPAVKFSYFVGSGTIQTSPVLSEDGTKIAFVESKVGDGVTVGSILHVLTIGTTGTNGTSAGSPVVPGIIGGNNAVDIPIILNGFVGDTRSSPFVDYSGDIAYVGDDLGFLHKITGVFNGTPTEVIGGGWPFPVVTATGDLLSSPVFDSVSAHIFIGGTDGFLYCITAAGAACATPRVAVASTTGVSGTNNDAVMDAPIVDSTTQKVFAAANTPGNTTTSIQLVQTDTSLGSVVTAGIGLGGNSGGTAARFDIFDGTFDNAYFTNVGTGHLYWVGGTTSGTFGSPNIRRVNFASNGTMTTVAASAYPLNANVSNGYPLIDTSPLTEIFNPTISGGTDLLFVGVKQISGGSKCPTTGNSCLIVINITTAFPASANVLGTFSTTGTNGFSGIIIDNVSGAAGASQVYFGALDTSNGVQASQSALQ